MPETSHRHRTRRRRSSSHKSGSKLRVVDIILLIWSLLSLGAFIYLLEKVHKAPLWQVAALGGSTVVGLIFFFGFSMRKKKG